MVNANLIEDKCDVSSDGCIGYKFNFASKELAFNFVQGNGDFFPPANFDMINQCSMTINLSIWATISSNKSSAVVGSTIRSILVHHWSPANSTAFPTPTSSIAPVVKRKSDLDFSKLMTPRRDAGAGAGAAVSLQETLTSKSDDFKAASRAVDAVGAETETPGKGSGDSAVSRELMQASTKYAPLSDTEPSEDTPTESMEPSGSGNLFGDGNEPCNALLKFGSPGTATGRAIQRGEQMIANSKHKRSKELNAKETSASPGPPKKKLAKPTSKQQETATTASTVARHLYTEDKGEFQRHQKAIFFGVDDLNRDRRSHDPLLAQVLFDAIDGYKQNRYASDFAGAVFQAAAAYGHATMVAKAAKAAKAATRKKQKGRGKLALRAILPGQNFEFASRGTQHKHSNVRLGDPPALDSDAFSV